MFIEQNEQLCKCQETKLSKIQEGYIKSDGKRENPMALLYFLHLCTHFTTKLFQFKTTRG